MSAAGLVAGSAWISIQLILKPDTAIWLNRFLPAWTQIPINRADSLQTLEEVQNNLRQAGLEAGTPIALAPDRARSATTDWLLPVLNRQQQIVELRVYRLAPMPRSSGQHEPYFWLASQVAITGPEESFVAAPLVEAQISTAVTNRPLPLSRLERYREPKLPSGIWFNLSGQWTRGNLTVPYGQILHYNPDRAYLNVMLQWASPASQQPEWREITGGGNPELLVNQTIGLEPKFTVYQVQPRNFLPDPIQMEAISLTEATSHLKLYRSALMLARSGLWSLSQQWMESLQRQMQPNQWSTTLQAQLDLIRLHASITRLQAEQQRASPSEEALVQLVEGHWAKALQVLESVDSSPEIFDLLHADTGRLENRIETALKLNPKQAEAKAWGALLISAQRGRSAAITWLNKQPHTTTATKKQIMQLLNQLETARPTS